MHAMTIRPLCMMLLATVLLLTSSCATLSPNGVGRIKRYTIESDRLPAAFDGCKVAFISDCHYPSLFTAKRLGRLVSSLSGMQPDILLLGGDYVSHNDSIDALFSALASVKPRYGTYAVLGNHERMNGEDVARSMQKHGIVLLSDSIVCIDSIGGLFSVAGVHDSFSNEPEMLQRIGSAWERGFVLLLAHTPDYAENSSVKADVVLSGHTHGGQVSLLGLYSPVKNTQYGNRFLHGMNMTSSGVPIITTSGVGTSRRKVRICVPSEIVMLYLVVKSRHL